MKKLFYRAMKTIIKHGIVKNANTTSSLIAHQPKPPKNIEKYKK